MKQGGIIAFIISANQVDLNKELLDQLIFEDQNSSQITSSES